MASTNHNNNTTQQTQHKHNTSETQTQRNATTRARALWTPLDPMSNAGFMECSSYGFLRIFSTLERGRGDDVFQ